MSNSYEQELDSLLENLKDDEGMPLPPEAVNVILNEFSARILAKILDRMEHEEGVNEIPDET